MSSGTFLSAGMQIDSVLLLKRPRLAGRPALKVTEFPLSSVFIRDVKLRERRRPDVQRETMIPGTPNATFPSWNSSKAQSSGRIRDPPLGSRLARLSFRHRRRP